MELGALWGPQEPEALLERVAPWLFVRYPAARVSDDAVADCGRISNVGKDRMPLVTGYAPSRYGKLLLVLFLLSLPMVNPWVRGDGVGYYAYVRALLIQHDLSFEADWLAANPSFLRGRVDASGRLLADQYTRTGHIDNHFSIGPAILWAPFLAVAHGLVLVADRLGANIAPDGFSRPYRLTMAVATALYGFVGLLLGFDLARRYFGERWAFLATLGIWFASSLPVYMYFNPSWSHAHSAFAVALFVWYWDRTRGARTWAQWALLGVLAGLMTDVYYPNALLCSLPLLESMARYRRAYNVGLTKSVSRLFGQNLAFAVVALAAFVPTLVTKKIIYGSYFVFGYGERWFWNSPALFRVCFSSAHGLFSWTPILIPAVVGLFFVSLYDRMLSYSAIIGFASYLYFIGCYQNWDGLSSFGNRFFVSLTPLFILGLAAAFDGLARWWRKPRLDFAVASCICALFVLWNFGFIFQWGTQIIPARGPISWREVARNQYAVVPLRIGSQLETYLFRRKGMMQDIEGQDLERLRQQQRQKP